MRKLVKRLKNQKGLTLVELLAVIVILGIIAAIAIPSIGNIVAKSKFDASKADALQIVNAAAMAHAAGEDFGENGLKETDLAEYLDITDDNLESGWTVTLNKTTNQIELSATFEHPAAKGEAVKLENKTRDYINKMTFEDPTPGTQASTP